MLKTNPSAYTIEVSGDGKTAFLLCLTYSIDREGKFFGSEFIELQSDFPSHHLSIPYGRAATFQEELRICGTSAAVAPEHRQDIEDWITTKMKRAYGQTVTATTKSLKS